MKSQSVTNSVSVVKNQPELMPRHSKKSPPPPPPEAEPDPQPPVTSWFSRTPKAKAPEPDVVPPPVYRVNNAGLYQATFYSNIGSFFFGIAMGWTGGAQRSVMEQSSYGFKPSTAQWQIVCMLLTLGATVWCLPTSFLLRAVGCKRTILMQLLPNTLGWCLTAFAQSIPMLYAGRFFLGMCGGAHCVAVPIYSAEISTVQKRGMMGVCFHGACMIGVIYSFVMCSVLELRIVNIVNLMLLVFGLLPFLMPESPVYYANRGQIPLAEHSLRWLRGKNHNMLRELASLTRKPSESQHDQRRYPLRGFKYKMTRRSLVRCVVLAVLQKLSGGFVYIFFTFDFLACQKLSYCWAIILAFSTVLGLLLCFFLVEKVGRRSLIIVCSAISFFASVILGIGIKLFLVNGGTVLPYINLVCMNLFVSTYAAGLGTLTWLLSVELLVMPMRPLGCSIAATISWLTALIAIIWYSAHESICQSYIFVCFAIVAVATLLFTLVYIPETKGQSLNKIQTLMGGIISRPTVTTVDSSSNDESDA